MLIFLNCISLIILSLGTYVIWWDRRNIFNHFFFGFCIIGYVIPSLIIDFSFIASEEIIRLYVFINVIGTVFFLFGLILGSKWKSVPLVDAVMRFSLPEQAIHSESFERKVLHVSKIIYIGSLVVMALCFVYMGYVPMFAEDPYSAKQFKGVYQPRYQQVALFYRTAKQFIQLIMPFLLMHFYNKRRITTMLLILCGIMLVFVSLSRGETVAGLLLMASIIISMRPTRTVFIVYIIMVVVFFSIGSSFWVIMSYYFPDSGFKSFVEGQTAADAIASGAPDITDQLTFLEAFVKNHVGYTYGATFFGGLIPFNFKWNPAAWTLMVMNDTNDISEISSGGLRLPVTLWGYVSFGWAGVAILPFMAAFFIGYITKRVKRIVNQLKPGYKGYFVFYYLAFLYLYIGIVFTEFYRISIYLFPAFILYGLINYLTKKRSPKVTQSA